MNTRLACLILFLSLANGCATPPLSSDRVPPKTDAELAAEQSCRQQRSADIVPHWRFTTDGCSLWPDGDWGACCVAHDEEYWCGGTAAQRLESDRRLRQCVIDAGHPVMGRLMFLGTRAGGWWVLPTPWRWSYGWPWLDNGDAGEGN